MNGSFSCMNDRFFHTKHYHDEKEAVSKAYLRRLLFYLWSYLLLLQENKFFRIVCHKKKKKE